MLFDSLKGFPLFQQKVSTPSVVLILSKHTKPLSCFNFHKVHFTANVPFKVVCGLRCGSDGDGESLYLPPRPTLRRARPTQRRGTVSAVREWRCRSGSTPASSTCPHTAELCSSRGCTRQGGGRKTRHTHL